MHCTDCGKQVLDTANFCTGCGAKQTTDKGESATISSVDISGSEASNMKVQHSINLTSEKIREKLSKYEFLSTSDVIRCPNCSYRGQWGFVSGKDFNWLTLIGILSIFLNLFKIMEKGYSFWATSMLAMGIASVFLGWWRENIFHCPNCDFEYKPFKHKSKNPLFKN